MRKQILSTLLALALALSLLPAGALAAEGDDETAAASEITEETGSDPESGTGPENSRTSVFAGGTGTREDPYKIATLEELKAFRDSVNDGESYQGMYIMLTADIDLGNEEWTPIGTEGKPFRGTFDGSGNTISNLYIEKGFDNTVQQLCRTLWADQFPRRNQKPGHGKRGHPGQPVCGRRRGERIHW